MCASGITLFGSVLPKRIVKTRQIHLVLCPISFHQKNLCESVLLTFAKFAARFIPVSFFTVVR